MAKTLALAEADHNGREAVRAEADGRPGATFRSIPSEGVCRRNRLGIAD